MPWVLRVDPTTGRTLAANPETYQCIWGLPLESILPGYEEHFNMEDGQWFYLDTKTGQVTDQAPSIDTSTSSFGADNERTQGQFSTISSAERKKRGDQSQEVHSFQNMSFLSLDKIGKRERQFAELPSGLAPTIPPEKQSLNSKVKMNPFQLEGFGKLHFVNPKKTVSQSQLKTILKFSKEKQTLPLIFSLRDAHGKLAILMWKNIGIYMEGKKFQIAEKIAEILAPVFQYPELQDELYSQLCKQTCYNFRPLTNLKCWELFTVVCAYVHPSSELEPFLVAYLREQLKDHKEKEAVYAACCLRRLRRTLNTKMATSIPPVSEIEHLIATSFESYMFEIPLSKVIENQMEEFPDLDIPVILPQITRLIVRLGGFRTEGIFRIPGDVDLVHQMKLQVESGNFEDFDTTDPRAPSSLLSLWLRELKEPLIPDAKYEECLQCISSPDQSLEVLNSVPSPNRETLVFLLQFLRTLISGENQQHTKMGSANMAMVFAPNFLRCRSPHPAVMLQNAKSEQQFVINLLSSFSS